ALSRAPFLGGVDSKQVRPEVRVRRPTGVYFSLGVQASVTARCCWLSTSIGANRSPRAGASVAPLSGCLGAGEFTLSVGRAAKRLVGATEIIVGLGGIGGELDSVLEGARRLIGTFQIQIHLTQGLVCLRIVRIDFHGVLKLHLRVVDAVLLEVHGAEIEGGGEIRGVEPKRAL